RLLPGGGIEVVGVDVPDDPTMLGKDELSNGQNRERLEAAAGSATATVPMAHVPTVISGGADAALGQELPGVQPAMAEDSPGATTVEFAPTNYIEIELAG